MALMMMLDVKQWATHFFDLWRSLKNEQLKWRAETQTQRLQLQQQQLLSEHDLASQLKIRNVQLEHELSLLKTTHQAQLSMLKTKHQQDINDYKQYLASLEQLKIAIQTNYTHLPAVIAFTIHHHAKQLLNAMWDAQSIDEKIQHELRLIRFMSTVQEDAQRLSSGGSPGQLPEKTLRLLERQ
jgi:hypothetical protein